MNEIERARIRRNISHTVEACGISAKTREGQEIVNRYSTLIRVTITSMLTERLRRIRAQRQAWRVAGAKRAGVPRPRRLPEESSAIDG